VGKMGEDEIGGIDKVGCSEKIAEAIAKKQCVADGRIYDTKHAESRDLAYIAQNTCMVCGKRFKKGEIRIKPPAFVQEKDLYVQNGIVVERYICTTCYETMRSSERERIKSDYLEERVERNKIIDSLVRRMLKEKV
jgi:DNA-directed RNA polymerase subunit M/transcription elongation factor TFIIS